MEKNTRKFRIRTTIVTLFVVLLTSIGSFIILINYYAGRNISFRTATNFVNQSENVIEQQILNFFEPAKDNLDFGGIMLQQHLITAIDTDALTEFLRRLIGNNQTYSGIHWTDAASNFNLVERGANNTYVNEIRLCKNNICNLTTRILDQNGKIISEHPDYSGYDPRTRPWYKKAILEKKFTITDVFTFHPFGENKSALGITAVKPIYSLQNPNQLIGLLSIDLKLDTLAAFLGKLEITPHTIIFIYDNQNNLIAAKVVDIFGTSQSPALQEHLPWITASFERFRQNKQPSFFYTYDKVKYLAFYKSLAGLVGNQWNIEIVLPVNDIVGEWNQVLIVITLIASIILLLGIILVWFVSRLISKPIRKIADEAIAIKQLDFSQIYPIKNFIEEIEYMQDAFSAMVQSLKSFSRYVSFNLVKKLVTSGDIAHVGGENKEITFLFSDINGFTSLSENMTPQNLMSYLSDYFQGMSKVILEHKGTVDKYIGDGIMAFWGAPVDDLEHAFHACTSALLMQDALASLNTNWKAKQKPEISIRIGINTGSTIVGNVGSDDKLSYTALGDSVNLCSRLQDLNKIYGTKIVVSGSTFNLVKNHFKFRFLDQVAVRGKSKAIFAYELLINNHPTLKNLEHYNTEFKTAFTFYQQSKWDEAIKIFEDLAKTNPGDKLLKIYIERCLNFKNTPPSNWDGIWRIQ